jgi:hypothetical protein
VLAGPDIGFGRFDECWALDDLPSDIEDEEDWNVDVCSEEVGDIETTDEGSETIENDDNREVDKGKPGSKRLKFGLEDKRVPINILSDEGRAEAEISNANCNPSEELGDGDEVLEPAEDILGTAGDDHVGEKRYGRSDGNTVNRNTLLCALEEDLGCLSVLGNTEEISRASVQESVCRRRSRSKDDGIDHAVKTLDSSTLNSNDPWGSECTCKRLIAVLATCIILTYLAR